jgi:hypothetical protein
LRFAVAQLPQIQGNSIKLTYGQLTGVAVSRTALNPTGAMTIAQKLSSQVAITALMQVSQLPPVRRDVTVDTSNNAPASVFAQSALIARSWLDLDKAKTDALFQDMVESVISSKSDPSGAVAEVSSSLAALLRAYTGQ